MRRCLGPLAALVLASATVTISAESKTVKGEVIDVQCQMKKAENKGSDHADCALSCAKKGAAMGILTADGVYTITGEYTMENNKKLIEYVARTVEATGEVTEKNGTRTIRATSIKAVH